MLHGPLILGATGRVGRLMQACAGEVWEPSPIWHGRTGEATFWQWDILNEAAPQVSCSGIVMLAGARDGTPDIHVALANAACDLGARLGVRVLLASSQAVYGAPESAVDETSPCVPRSDYGKAKLAMEAAVAGRPNVCCMRIGNVIGADDLLGSVARGFVHLDQWPDGTGPQRAMIGPVTLSRAFRDLLALPEVPPVLNLAQPGLIGMEAVLEALAAPWAWRKAGATALHRLEMDLSLARSLIEVPAATAAGVVEEARACGWCVP